MARNASRKSQSSTFSKRSRQGASSRSASAFYGDVLGIAGSLLRNRQEAGAEKIGSLADAARNFAAELNDIPTVQTYVSAVAEQIENLSDYVSDNSMEDMVDGATEFARRHPVATAAFAVAVGFGFTRMMTHNSASHATPKQKTARASATSRSTRSATSRKRAAVKVRANGRDLSHDRANAS